MTDGDQDPKPTRPAVPNFYRPENYRPEESIGYMMRRILTVHQPDGRARLCEPGGPTYPQWIPLYKLHMGMATTVAELARECQLDTGAMTRLLDRLEAKGLCRRVRSVSDRRVVNIELTDEGRAAAEQVPQCLAVCRTNTCAASASRSGSSCEPCCAGSSITRGDPGRTRRKKTNK